jgi:Pyridoxamine 5'-phosphate oxidase
MTDSDRAALGRSIIERNLYMVLGTADAAGQPWATPVYFAPAGFRELFWVSSPEANHSRNIAERPEIGVVVFDSQLPIGTGQAVYMHARAQLVPDGELERGIQVFSDRSISHGGMPFTVADVTGASGIRLYRATAADHSMLAKDGKPDHRVPVDLGRRRGSGRNLALECAGGVTELTSHSGG